MAELATERMTQRDFLNWQTGQDALYELVDGRPVPRSMTGATRRHDRIVTNAILSFGARLRDGPCWPSTADIAVRTGAGLRRPDLTIDCGPFDPASLVAGEPVLVLEVLSPSTERIDTIVKLDEYRALASLRHILIAEPDAAHVLMYSRGRDDRWTSLDHIGLDTVLEMSAPACTLPLAELYDRVPLSAPTGAAVPFAPLAW